MFRYVTALISSCLTCGAQTPNALTPEEKRAGWELLFDGATSKGWRSPGSDKFPEGYWLVEDGFLRCARIGNRTTDLITTGLYRNFDLRFEWKIEPGGNSGLKYFVGSSQKLVFEGTGMPKVEGTVVPGPNAEFKENTSGLEYQFVDEERHSDGRKSTTKSGALYEIVGIERSVAKPAGELNTSRIVVNGSHIEHWLNDVRVIATDFNSPEFLEAIHKAPGRTQRALEYLNKECPLALQSHTRTVWVRSIRILRLPASR